MKLYLIDAIVHEPGNPESLREALIDLATDQDGDFDGQNGDEYLWDGLKELGYKSNMEYAADEAIKLFDGYGSYTDGNVVGAFIDMWMKHDTWYWDYKWTIDDDGSGNTSYIALAFITE